MGLARREALRNLADRLNVSEISSFVSVILQSEQLGMSISDTLHAQAEQMRIERRFRAQEQARTIPIKMLVPLAFLILPAIMAVILGPAIPQILDLFEAL
jgi:tight adherence protein C